MTHLHIPVLAITRGTLARTHELKNDLNLTSVLLYLLVEFPQLQYIDLNVIVQFVKVSL